jgi:hypothetical protein
MPALGQRSPRQRPAFGQSGADSGDQSGGVSRAPSTQRVLRSSIPSSVLFLPLLARIAVVREEGLLV